MRCRFALGGLGIKDVDARGGAGGGEPVPPTVDAGGPYEEYNDFNIDGASLTPGSDPSPTIAWSLIGPSGTVGSFTNGDTISPVFTWTTLIDIPIVIRVTVTPNDGPAVTDDALLEVIG